MINTIGVVGAGNMGQGLARTFAQAGIKVIFREVSQEKVDDRQREGGHPFADLRNRFAR